MSSWETYLKLARKYQKIPLSEERLLIAQAKKGSQKSIVAPENWTKNRG